MERLSQRARCRGLNLFEFIAFLAIAFGLAYGFTRGLEEGLWEAALGALQGAGIAWL